MRTQATVAQTSPFLPTDSHESTCNPQSPKLIFDIEDAHLTTITSHFDYGHLENETVVSKKTGTLPTTSKGILEVPLCADTFGAAFQTPGAQHQVAIWVTDSAGNPSKPITVQFTVTWETPPLWVGPSQAPLDKWDLASYSFDDFTIHKPFATPTIGGTLQNTYRALQYEVVNPHPIALTVTLDHLGTVIAEVGMRRGYLYWQAFSSPDFCNVDLCSYLVGEYPGEEPLTPGWCVNKVKFETLMWQDLAINQLVELEKPGGSGEFVQENAKIEIPPHTTATLSWRLDSSNTCAIPPPHTFEIAQDPTKSVQFYPMTGLSCIQYGNAATGNTSVPYELESYAGIASCTAAVVGGKMAGANFFVPLLHMALRTRLYAGKLSTPVVLGLTYTAQAANPKTLVIQGTNEVLWSDTFHPAPSVGNQPYYNL